jgi:hypothetical protein
MHQVHVACFAIGCDTVLPSHTALSHWLDAKERAKLSIGIPQPGLCTVLCNTPATLRPGLCTVLCNTPATLRPGLCTVLCNTPAKEAREAP